MHTAKIIFGIGICALILAGIFGFHQFQLASDQQQRTQAGPPTVTVRVTTAKLSNWHPYIESVGRLRANQGIDIRAEVSGIVTRIYFESGTRVNKGDRLISLNSDILKAKLKQAQAQRDLNKLAFDRNRRLFKQGTLSKSTLDEVKANLAAAQGLVDEYHALLAQHHLVAPFTGKMGLRNISEGEYITAGQALSNLQMVDPMYVDFEIPEQYIRQVSIGQSIELTTSKYAGHVYRGAVMAIDAEIGKDTHSFTVRARVPNHTDNAILLPGAFVNVHLLQAEEKNIIAIPERAITYTLYGNHVFVLDKNGDQNIARQVAVEVGAKKPISDEVIIKAGIKAGDTIVTDGKIRLRTGLTVLIEKA